MTDIHRLIERLDKLERRHRKLQILMLLIVLAFGAVMLLGQAPPQVPPNRTRPEGGNVSQIPRESRVRAEGFVLTDSKGNERASLVTDEGGSVFLVMFDKNGKPRADLQVNNYGPSLNFYDPDARTRLAVGSTTLVASHVNISGVVEKNTPSSIVMFDGTGHLLWRTP